MKVNLGVIGASINSITRRMIIDFEKKKLTFSEIV
jgi:hypothetical protein